MKNKKMTTFEKAKAIRSTLLTRVAEGLVYKTWSDEFRLSNIKNVFESVKVWEEKYGSFKINPTDMTLEEMVELGFGVWDSDNPMRLIPLWLLPFLAENFESESISGSKHTKLSEVDDDHRFGCLAYGVLPKKQ